MRKWLSRAGWTFAGSAAGAAADTMWLALTLLTAAAAVGLIWSAGPVGAQVGQLTGRRRLMFVLGIGLAGGIICALGATFALNAYEKEQRDAQTEREATEGLKRELKEARARSDAAESRRRREFEKFSTASKRIVDAIEEGGNLKYTVEHARNTDRVKFGEEFQRIHVAAFERWRTKTATILNEELPPHDLGTVFASVEGKSGEPGDVYLLTKLEACIDTLREFHRDLRGYVERMSE